jgi:sporulation protein YlmC with PRC-barrel domain
MKIGNRKTGGFCMQEKRILNVEKDLKGMTVLKTDGRKMGEVLDAVIHPVEGKMLGIIIHTPEDRNHILISSNFFIGPDAIMADAKARFEEIPSNNLTGGVPALGAVVGTNLITEEGKLIGRVNEIHISTKKPYVVYRIVESTLQKFLGGGFFIPADVVRAYSDDGVRMIVPSDLEDRYAAPTLEDAMSLREQVAARKRQASHRLRSGVIEGKPGGRHATK